MTGSVLVMSETGAFNEKEEATCLGKQSGVGRALETAIMGRGLWVSIQLQALKYY